LTIDYWRNAYVNLCPQLFAAAAPIDRPRFGVAVICAASVSITALGSRGDLLLHLMVDQNCRIQQ
jgi:hypothetical protein